MNYLKLTKISNLDYFTVEGLSKILGITLASARLLATRYAKRGLFIRIRNNFYLIDKKWQSFERKDFFRIANYVQIPSYISFMSALGFYEITTQIQQNFFESACLKRSISYEAGDMFFKYFKLNKTFYNNFVKRDGMFIATPEKAFVDVCYLYSFGKYKIDFDSLSLEKLDKKEILRILTPYPRKTKGVVRKICEI